MRARSLPRGPSLHGTARLLALAVVVLGLATHSVAAGDPERGAELFRSCAACHSLQPGEHRSGPSLADIFGREAGTIEGFNRYSPALERADVTWTAEALDTWLANPQAMIPGNRMTFPGIGDDQARADLIAYLQAATAERSGTASRGGASPDLPNLGALEPDQQVARIRYCGDTYRVTTAAGKTIPFWEFNVRFKTDSSDRGQPNADVKRFA